MSDEEKIELVRGSGNVFRDFGDAYPDLEQAKAILAARIIGTLDEQGLSTRQAARVTGYQQADFARLRKVQTGRFTLDRLIKILNALDDSLQVNLSVDRRQADLKKLRREWRRGIASGTSKNADIEQIKRKARSGH